MTGRQDLPDRPDAGWSRPALVGALYGGLTLAALVWRASRGNPNMWVHPFIQRDFTVWGPIAGVAFGLMIVWLSRLAVSRLNWARRLHLDFRAVLGPLDRREIFMLAATSSIGEECFFRGAMLPDLGLFASSTIFALLHVGPGLRYLPWTLSAWLIGLAMGGGFILFGDLTAPVLAHFTINYLNLHYIVKNDVAG